jgi:hypothetical protein
LKGRKTKEKTRRMLSRKAEEKTEEGIEDRKMKGRKGN